MKAILYCTSYHSTTSKRKMIFGYGCKVEFILWELPPYTPTHPHPTCGVTSLWCNPMLFGCVVKGINGVLNFPIKSAPNLEGYAMENCLKVRYQSSVASRKHIGQGLDVGMIWMAVFCIYILCACNLSLLLFKCPPPWALFFLSKVGRGNTKVMLIWCFATTPASWAWS